MENRYCPQFYAQTGAFGIASLEFFYQVLTLLEGLLLSTPSSDVGRFRSAESSLEKEGPLVVTGVWNGKGLGSMLFSRPKKSPI